MATPKMKAISLRRDRKMLKLGEGYPWYSSDAGPYTHIALRSRANGHGENLPLKVQYGGSVKVELFMRIKK